MIIKRLLLSLGTALLLLHAMPSASSGQSQVFIENAERAEGTIVETENVRKLLGSVILRTGDMVMRADSAYQFIDSNFIHAFNIQIETEDEIIWADTLYHDVERDFSQFRGRVIIESENNTVFSQKIDLSSPQDLATFLAPVRFQDRSGSLLAQSGLYYQKTDSAVFKGDVQLADTTQYLEADSLFMNRSRDLYELHGRVFADDFEEKVTFEGDYLFADSTGYRLLTGNDAWLMEVSESEADTTHLISKKIELQETDTTSSMEAFTSVRIWSTKFAAIADTAIYRDDAEQFLLKGSPVLWQDNIQLTGPVIEATLKDDNIEFLRSFPRPIAVQEDTATGRLNQMTGDTLHAYFEQEELQRLVVFDNSEIIFHQKDEDGNPDGLMELIAAGSSTMTFREGEFDNFKANQNIDGFYLPEAEDLTERRLENFRWDPELKPQRPVIRTPRLSEVPDEPPFELPPRYERYLEQRIRQIDPPPESDI